jgi:hypothetical protein
VAVGKWVSGYNWHMEFFFTQPDDERLTPTNTRLLDLHAEAYPDGKRLQISLDHNPFQQNPYGVYNLVATLSFPDLGEIDHRNLAIEIPSYTV